MHASYTTHFRVSGKSVPRTIETLSSSPLLRTQQCACPLLVERAPSLCRFRVREDCALPRLSALASTLSMSTDGLTSATCDGLSTARNVDLVRNRFPGCCRQPATQRQRGAAPS